MHGQKAGHQHNAAPPCRKLRMLRCLLQSTSGEPDAVRFQPAASFAPLMDEVYQQLTDR
jgi:hypothetical protein